MHPDLFGHGSREEKMRDARERGRTGAPLGHVPQIGRPDRETIIGHNDFDRLHDALEIEGSMDVERFLERIDG